MALSEMRWQLIAMGVAYAALTGVYAGLPLGVGGGLQTEPPIFATGYDILTKTFIFSMQGLATLLPWVLDINTTKTVTFVKRIWWLWICTWAAETCWTVTHYIMQSKYQGALPVVGFSIALLALVCGHVLMSVAIRRLMRTCRNKLLQAMVDNSITGIQLAALGLLLYVIPSAVYAGWLALVSCVSIIQLAEAAGASYDALTTASIVLLMFTGSTALFQPWILRPGLFYFVSNGEPHQSTQLKNQQLQPTLTRMHRIRVVYWAAFCYTSYWYGFTIWWALAEYPEERQPQALQRAWIWLEVACYYLFIPMGALGRIYLDSRFPPRRVLDALRNAATPGTKNGVLYGDNDENTRLLNSGPPTDVSASSC